jgi:hypothetical protein
MGRSDNHEFGRLDESKVDQPDRPPIVDGVLRRGNPSTAHEERVYRGTPDA